MTNPLAQPGQPFEVELLFSNATAGNRKGAPIYRVSFELDEAAWLEFRHAAANIRLRAIAWLAADDDSDAVLSELFFEALNTERLHEALTEANATEPVKAAKGEHGKYWQEFFRRGLQFAPQIKDALEVRGEASASEIKHALKRVFDVSSLTFVSPEQALEWARGFGLDGLFKEEKL